MALPEAITALRSRLAVQGELYRWWAALQRPWECESLHWSRTPSGEVVLHGRFLPAPGHTPTMPGGRCACPHS